MIIELKINAQELFEFTTYNDWLHNSNSMFKKHSHKPNVCIATDGSVCHIGEDFLRAREWNLFPIKVYTLQRTIESTPF
jgi:hypothetical protein